MQFNGKSFYLLFKLTCHVRESVLIIKVFFQMLNWFLYMYYITVMPIWESKYRFKCFVSFCCIIKFGKINVYLNIFAVFPSNSGIAISGAVEGYVTGIYSIHSELYYVVLLCKLLYMYYVQYINIQHTSNSTSNSYLSSL